MTAEHRQENISYGFFAKIRLCVSFLSAFVSLDSDFKDSGLNSLVRSSNGTNEMISGNKNSYFVFLIHIVYTHAHLITLP